MFVKYSVNQYSIISASKNASLGVYLSVGIFVLQEFVHGPMKLTKLLCTIRMPKGPKNLLQNHEDMAVVSFPFSKTCFSYWQNIRCTDTSSVLP